MLICYTIKMDETLKKTIEEVSFDWLDSNTLILDSEKKLKLAGTVLKINNNIIFLQAFTNDQLLRLKECTILAVDHELNKRLGKE